MHNHPCALISSSIMRFKRMRTRWKKHHELLLKVIIILPLLKCGILPPLQGGGGVYAAKNEEAFQHYKMIFREVLHNGKDVFIHSIFYRWICFFYISRRGLEPMRFWKTWHTSHMSTAIFRLKHFCRVRFQEISFSLKLSKNWN